MATALEQLAREPASRRRFMKELAGAGALASFATVLSSCGQEKVKHADTARGPSADRQIINYALTLEYLEADFYRRVTKSGLFSGRKKRLFDQIYANELAHVRALKSTAREAGGSVAKPATNFDSVFDGGQRAVLHTAAKLENLGAGAYLGAAREIVNTRVLAAALSIHSVEGRHAGVLNHLIGKSFAPDGPLATPLSRDEVLAEAETFLV
jgi:hypothetical protein